MKAILFILLLPPPVYGSSMIGQFIKDSEKIKEAFSCRFLNLLASKDLSDSGKISAQKRKEFVLI